MLKAPERISKTTTTKNSFHLYKNAAAESDMWPISIRQKLVIFCIFKVYMKHLKFWKEIYHPLADIICH